MRYFTYLLLSALLLTACTPKLPEAPKAPTAVTPSPARVPTKVPIRPLVPEWTKDAVLYEVNIRQYSEEGTFNAVTEDLQRLKDMGIDILWLMPIHPIGEAKRKGSLGSYYAVKDYMKVNPEYGTEEDFQNLVNKVHSLGMKIIIDWVPNHSAWDNWLIEEHPEYYTKNEKGEIIDPIDPGTGESWGWTDVADFNYEETGLRDYMREALVYWVEEYDIDGYRCDVAGEVPMDFWRRAHREIAAVKPVFMLAEAQGAYLHREGNFHMSYNWDFHHLKNKIAKGEEPASALGEFFSKQSTSFQPQDYLLNFTTNHDENSWNGTVFERLGDGHKAFAFLAFTAPGMPLIYSGQEAPLKKRLEFFEKDAIDWNGYELTEFYADLFQLKKANSALWNGTYGGNYKQAETSKDDKVWAFTRIKDLNMVAGIVNLSSETVNVELKDDTFYKITGERRFTLKPWEHRFFSNASN